MIVSQLTMSSVPERLDVVREVEFSSSSLTENSASSSSEGLKSRSVSLLSADVSLIESLRIGL